jgi:hypothetical protein
MQWKSKEISMFRTLCAASIAILASGILAACSDSPQVGATSAVPAGVANGPSAPMVTSPEAGKATAVAATIPPPAPNAPDNSATPTAVDSAALDPKGTLDKDEESKSMPMAGHGNNHSSPALESPPKQ